MQHVQRELSTVEVCFNLATLERTGDLSRSYPASAAIQSTHAEDKWSWLEGEIPPPSDLYLSHQKIGQIQGDPLLSVKHSMMIILTRTACCCVLSPRVTIILINLVFGGVYLMNLSVSGSVYRSCR